MSQTPIERFNPVYFYMTKDPEENRFPDDWPRFRRQAHALYHELPVIKEQKKLNLENDQLEISSHHISVYELHNRQNHYNQYHHTLNVTSLGTGQKYGIHIYFSNFKQGKIVVELHDEKRVLIKLPPEDQTRLIEFSKSQTINTIQPYVDCLDAEIKELLTKQAGILSYENTLPPEALIPLIQTWLQDHNQLTSIGVLDKRFKKSAMKFVLNRLTSSSTALPEPLPTVQKPNETPKEESQPSVLPMQSSSSATSNQFALFKPMRNRQERYLSQFRELLAHLKTQTETIENANTLTPDGAIAYYDAAYQAYILTYHVEPTSEEELEIKNYRKKAVFYCTRGLEWLLISTNGLFCDLSTGEDLFPTLQNISARADMLTFEGANRGIKYDLALNSIKRNAPLKLEWILEYANQYLFGNEIPHVATQLGILEDPKSQEVPKDSVVHDAQARHSEFGVVRCEYLMEALHNKQYECFVTLLRHWTIFDSTNFTNAFHAWAWVSLHTDTSEVSEETQNFVEKITNEYRKFIKIHKKVIEQVRQEGAGKKLSENQALRLEHTKASKALKRDFLSARQLMSSNQTKAQTNAPQNLSFK